MKSKITPALATSAGKAIADVFGGGNLSPVDELLQLRKERAYLHRGGGERKTDLEQLQDAQDRIEVLEADLQKARAGHSAAAPGTAPRATTGSIALPASVDQAREIYARYTALKGRAQAEFFDRNAAALKMSADMIEHADSTESAPELSADVGALYLQYEALMNDGRSREAAEFFAKHEAAFLAAIR